MFKYFIADIILISAYEKLTKKFGFDQLNQECGTKILRRSSTLLPECNPTKNISITARESTSGDLFDKFTVKFNNPNVKLFFTSTKERHLIEQFLSEIKLILEEYEDEITLFKESVQNKTKDFEITNDINIEIKAKYQDTKEDLSKKSYILT